MNQLSENLEENPSRQKSQTESIRFQIRGGSRLNEDTIKEKCPKSVKSHLKKRKSNLKRGQFFPKNQEKVPVPSPGPRLWLHAAPTYRHVSLSALSLHPSTPGFVIPLYRHAIIAMSMAPGYVTGSTLYSEHMAM